MGKFCTKCGRPLQEGEICSCQTAAGNGQGYQQAQPLTGQPNQQQTTGQSVNGQPNQQQTTSQSVNDQPFQQQATGQPFYGQPGQQQAGSQPFHTQQFGPQASVFAQNFFGRVLNLVKKPVTAGKELIMEADVKVAMLLIVFQGVFSGLFAMLIAGKCSQLMKTASGLADSFSYGLGNAVTGALSMPYFRIFIVAVLSSVVLACALAVMSLLGYMLMKIPASFQQMLSAAGIRSAVLVPAIILSIIVFELFPGYGIALFLLINIWGFAAMIVAMSSLIGQEKLNIFVLVMSIIILLFSIVAVFVFSKTWTLYLPDLLRTTINSLGNMSPKDLLEMLDSY